MEKDSNWYELCDRCSGTGWTFRVVRCGGEETIESIPCDDCKESTQEEPGC